MPVASYQGQLLTTAEEDIADGCVRLPVIGCFWTLLEIFAFFIWIWLLIIVFTDIFRSRDLSGVAKTLWVVFVLIVPLLGILIYLIAHGGSMHEQPRRKLSARMRPSGPTYSRLRAHQA